MRFKMNLTAFLAAWVFMAFLGYLSPPVQGRLVVACIFVWNARWKMFSPFLCSLYLSWSSPATVNNFRLKLRTLFCVMSSFALLKSLSMTRAVYTDDFCRVPQCKFVALKLDQIPNRFETTAISRLQNRSEIWGGLHLAMLKLHPEGDKSCIKSRHKNRLCKRVFTESQVTLPF